MHHRETEELNLLKNRLQKYIDLVFPEYNKLFKTFYSKAYMHILYTFQSADNIAKTAIRTLRKELGNMVTLSAENLKAAAKSSIGNSNSALEISIRNTVNSIYTCMDNLKVVDKKIEEFSLQLNPSILTIPGIYHTSAMSIIAEIGPIDRFQNAKQIIKFAGVNPFVYESGTKSIEQTAIEKKGSKYLRKTLYQVILPILRYNPVFYNYYKKKRKEGKKDLCAKGHCVRKLIRVIFHLLSTNQEFDPALLV